MEKKSKHIVILTPGFPVNESDTTCIPGLQIYVKALGEISGCKISVITLHYPFKPTKYIWNSIPVYSLGGCNRKVTKILIWRKTFQMLKQIHLENSITNIHSFWLGECALIGHWFSTKNQIKHITTLLGQDARKGNLYTKILPIKKMQFICCSIIQQQIFYKNYDHKSRMISLGINTSDFIYSLEKTVDIIGIGSLIPLKNYDLFLDVIHELNKTQPIQAVLIGDGIQRKMLQQKINLLQLENVISLKGILNYSETISYVSKSKILLHTSVYEGFGLVFSEALQSKTMIVSKAVGAAFLTENWLICVTKNEMVKACRELLSKSFSEDYPNPFTIEKTVQNYLEIYNE